MRNFINNLLTNLIIKILGDSAVLNALNVFDKPQDHRRAVSLFFLDFSFHLLDRLFDYVPIRPD